MICKHILLIIFLNEYDHIFFCTQLNGFKYCYVSLTIQLNISYYTHLNNQTVLFLAIQFSISYLFAHSYNVKQFYLTHR